MEKKTYVINFDYDESRDNLLEVYGLEGPESLDNVKADLLGEAADGTSFSSILVGALDSGKLEGNQLIMLATMGLQMMSPAFRQGLMLAEINGRFGGDIPQ